MKTDLDATLDAPLPDDPAEAFAEEVYAELDEDPAAGLELARSAPEALSRAPAVRLALAHAVASVHGEATAAPLLESLVFDHPDLADARHSLALVYEALGKREAMIDQFLEVTRLDASEDAQAGFDLPNASSAIVEMVASVIEGLPEEFRERLARVPVVVEARPSDDLIRDGFDPRSVGLFEGSGHGEHVWEAPGTPPRIVLYAANLTASLDPDDPEALEREVEITVLHEVGHYFGLDEERLSELGLG